MSTFFLQQLVNGLTLGSVYGLIAIGYTMVYGIIGMINFAHGEVYMISAYLCAIGLALLSSSGLSPSPADSGYAGVHHRGNWRVRLDYRAYRLQATAQLHAPGAAYLRHRDVAYPAKLRPAEPGPRQQGADHARRRDSTASWRRVRADNLHQSVYSARLVCRHAVAYVDNQPYPAGADVPRGTAGSQNGSILGINTDRIISRSLLSARRWPARRACSSP